MKRQKFGLVEHVFLILGAKRAALYDLKSGDVYSIDECARRLLGQCESGASLQEIFGGSEALDSVEVIGYLQELANKGLGRFLGPNEEIEKIELGQGKNPILEFIWLEVTGGCNLQCIHCYAGSGPSLVGRDQMSLEGWKSVLSQAAVLGCRKVQLLGGEPFILGKGLIELIECAGSEGFTFVEVFTNATILSEEMLSALVRNKTNVAISFFSENAEVHDSITLGKNSHTRTTKNIKRMLDARVSLRVSIIGMKQNQDDIKETEQYLKEKLGVANIVVDLVRPSGRGRDSTLVPDKLVGTRYLREPGFPKCTARTFIQRRSGHNCFAREVCVAPSGDVYPCIMERDVVYGNVLGEKLENILNRSTTRKIRQLSKDNIKVCKNCEYRYVCFDCRPHAKNMSGDGDFCVKPKECLYNPYDGRWHSVEGC